MKRTGRNIISTLAVEAQLGYLVENKMADAGRGAAVNWSM